jgi:superfamily II DNA/RNA helicase
MPTADTDNVQTWENEQAQRVLTSRRYTQHFAELITRRLRLELSAERQAEPEYSHSLPTLEHTAHYFLNASRHAAEHEAIAYSHESAILFEQVSDLLKYKDLPEGPDARYRDNQSVLSALMYYLAGYEANAIVLAEKYLDGASSSDWTVYGASACLFLSKRFMVLRQYINDTWNVRPMPDVEEYHDDSALAELTYLAADRATVRAAMCFMDYLRSAQDNELKEALRSLSLAAQGYDVCGDTVGACITRTFGLALRTLGNRSLHAALSDYQSTTGLLMRYARLLLAGDKPVSELWRSQLQLGPHILNEDSNAVISLPTSAGKTRLAELAILRSLDRDPEKKALYLVPTRALAAEVELTLGQHFGPLGYRVSALFGGYDLSDFEEQIIDECQVLVTTPEKCDLLIRSKEDFLSNVSLLICDEGHQVGGGTRGVTYEFVLSRILWHATKSSIRVVMLSAVLSNLDVVSKWLHAGISQADRWKPTRSRLVYFGWKGNDGQLLFLDESLKVGTQYAFVPGVLDRRQTQRSRDGWIGSLAIHFAGVGTTLVFSPRPAQCEALAKKIRNIAKKGKIDTLSNRQNVIDEEHIPFIEQVIGKDHELIKCLSRGIAFHHGRLPHAVRVRVEKMVRNGLVSVIVANETLAQGVNLPIKAIIIDKLSRGSGGNLVSVRDFWNIAGRAGRAGKEVEGYVVFVQDGNDGHIQNYVFRYFADGQYEPTTSILLSTICEALLPRQYEIWAHAKEVQKVRDARYAEFWPAAIDLTVNKAKELLPLIEYTTFREALESALKEKLAPGYRYNRDREHWADVLTQALRSILLSDILPFNPVSLTSDLWTKLLTPIDSQLLATIVEDILANQEARGRRVASAFQSIRKGASGAIHLHMCRGT